ncbi:MAG: ribbon-helix-helix protein, CopG family [Erysipelotrichaceae bacterium]|nr:ribbon-helix-helix protein, CopG family [Erysipelotrichaceae bacterium]
MTISLRLSDEDTKLIKDYAKINNVSISDLIRQAVIEKIEDEIDLDAYNKAIKSFKKNPKTYSLDEIEKELGL